MPASEARLPGTRRPGINGKTYTPHRSAAPWIAALITCKRFARVNNPRTPGACKLLEELYDKAIARGGDLRDDRAAESIAEDVGWAQADSVRRHSITAMRCGEVYVAESAGCHVRSDGRPWHGLPTNLRILVRPLAYLHLAPRALRERLLADPGIQAAIAWLRATAARASAVVARGTEGADQVANPHVHGGLHAQEAFLDLKAFGSSPSFPSLARDLRAAPAPADGGSDFEAGPGGGVPAGRPPDGDTLHGLPPAGLFRAPEEADPSPATPLVGIDDEGPADRTVAEEWLRRRIAIARIVLEGLGPLLARSPALAVVPRHPRHADEAALQASRERTAIAMQAAEAARLARWRERIAIARELDAGRAATHARTSADAVALDLVDFRRSPSRWLPELAAGEREQLRRDLERLDPRLLTLPWPASGYDAGGTWREVPGAAEVVATAIATAERRKYGSEP